MFHVEQKTAKMKKVTEMIQKVQTAYNNAVASNLEAETSWYHEANNWINRLAEKYGHTPAQIAGLTAVLSAQKSWSENQRLVEQSLEMGVVSGNTTVQNDKGQKILDSVPCPVGIYGVIGKGWQGGLKTRTFYLNMLLPNNSMFATIDRHAIKVAGVDRDTVTPVQYRKIEAAYIAVAAELEMPVHELQAITWVWWRTLSDQEKDSHLS